MTPEAALYIAGHTLAEVAAQLGVSRDTIRRRLLAQGVKIRKRNQNPRRKLGNVDRDQAIVEACEGGASYSEAAKLFGLTKSRIGQIVTDAREKGNGGTVQTISL